MLAEVKGSRCDVEVVVQSRALSRWLREKMGGSCLGALPGYGGLQVGAFQGRREMPDNCTCTVRTQDSGTLWSAPAKRQSKKWS